MDYITDEMVVKRAKAAVRLAIEKNNALDVPSVIYDEDTGVVYELYSNGTKRPIEDTPEVGV